MGMWSVRIKERQVEREKGICITLFFFPSIRAFVRLRILLLHQDKIKG